MKYETTCLHHFMMVENLVVFFQRQQYQSGFLSIAEEGRITWEKKSRKWSKVCSSTTSDSFCSQTWYEIALHIARRRSWEKQPRREWLLFPALSLNAGVVYVRTGCYKRFRTSCMMQSWPLSPQLQRQIRPFEALIRSRRDYRRL